MATHPGPRTLAEKVWDSHVVVPGENGKPDLLYIDLHLVHEVTSPQAFEGLRIENRPLRRLDLTIATEDHNTPTENIFSTIADITSRTQIETLRRNAAEFGMRIHPLGDKEQGIVHVVGPQLGLTMPGLTVVCGDSHTSTHGAFGALAFGIGTSEVEHVMATQTLPLARFKTMAINVEGTLKPGVTAKDIILAVIAQIGTGGTNPGQGIPLSQAVPSPDDFEDENEKAAAARALEYMNLTAGTPMKDIPVDVVFLGSCTNSRIEDLRAAANIIRGRTMAPGVRMMVVPGSQKVRAQAEEEGLDKVFKDFGADWRFAGCSMCLGMNPDQLAPGERCASTSNRNFEGRQGKGGRTHLVSPLVAAATAVRGTLSSPSDLSDYQPAAA